MGCSWPRGDSVLGFDSLCTRTHTVRDSDIAPCLGCMACQDIEESPQYWYIRLDVLLAEWRHDAATSEVACGSTFQHDRPGRPLQRYTPSPVAIIIFSTCTGTAGGSFVPAVTSFVKGKPALRLQLLPPRIQPVAVAARSTPSASDRAPEPSASAASASSDSESEQSEDTRSSSKQHANRGRTLGPQSPQHLNNRLNSLKRTLMAQTPERRRKRCSICGEIGHNKLSCPTAPDAMPRKNTVTCSQCGQPGHNSRSCPVKPRSTTVTCSQCGRDGHNCRTCPMRAKTKKGSKAATNSNNSLSRVCTFSALTRPSVCMNAVVLL